MKTAKAIVKVAGKKGKTKVQIADAVGISYSHAAKTVNDLLFEGKLEIVSRTKSGADVFRQAREVEISAVTGKLVTVTI